MRPASGTDAVGLESSASRCKVSEDDKTRGRPARHKDERLSKNRTFRVRDQLDQQLQAAANQSGRSVSEEIERRLKSSFAVPIDPRFAKFFSVLSEAIRMLLDEEQKFGWHQRHYEYRLLTLALAGALNEVAPDFYRLDFVVGDANRGPEKTYTEFANRLVEDGDKQRESFRASGKAGEDL